MRLLPELEAYRDRLVERAAAWPDTPEPELLADLQRCSDQIALLEKGIAELTSRLPEDRPRGDVPAFGSEGGGSGRSSDPGEYQIEADRTADRTIEGGDVVERLLRRIAVQSQMRDLTAAYAEVLRRHIATVIS